MSIPRTADANKTLDRWSSLRPTGLPNYVRTGTVAVHKLAAAGHLDGKFYLQWPVYEWPYEGTLALSAFAHALNVYIQQGMPAGALKEFGMSYTFDDIAFVVSHEKDGKVTVYGTGLPPRELEVNPDTPGAYLPLEGYFLEVFANKDTSQS